MSNCQGCSGTCCTGVGSDPCTCTDAVTEREEEIHGQIAVGLASLVSDFPDSLAHPYVRRHLKAHAEKGDVLDHPQIVRALASLEEMAKRMERRWPRTCGEE